VIQAQTRPSPDAEQRTRWVKERAHARIAVSALAGCCMLLVLPEWPLEPVLYLIACFMTLNSKTR
jgi:hypothetical protein